MESQPSLLAVVHDVLAIPPAFDERCTPHPFGASYSATLARLNAILNMTTQLSHALSQLSAVPPSGQTSKLVSLMKQHTTMSTSITLSRAAAIYLSAEQRVVVFPDTAPPSPTRLEEWGRTVGMEAFIDSSGTSAATTIMMAGTVLVLDVDIDGGVVKTSFAIGNNNANGSPAAPDLDAFLARDIARWVHAANRASLAAAHNTRAEDPAVEAAYLGLVVQDHLRYLMMLDSLAVAEGERGIRWFMEPVSAAQHFLDAQKSIGQKHQPLDKMLARHSLPLLYLDAPSLSFLVWLSPLSYLRLLRSSPTTQPQASSSNPSIDIPVAHLTTALSEKYDGATIARLKLVPSPEGVGTSPHSSFPSDHTFPQVPSHSWVLEFNRPSRSRHQPGNYGVVVSQSRLRAIQAVLAVDMSTDVLMNMSLPGGSAGAGLGNLGTFGSVTGMNMGNLAFNGFMMGPSHAQSIDSGSWVDLLLNNGSPAEYYKATYNSPSQAHPPLGLRLAAPQEPGFLLQEVPVKTASEVSHILDIVREQCWLNELLGMLQWQPDSTTLAPKDPTSVLSASGVEVEEPESLELASVLAGTVTPRSIPVSVYLPSAMLPPLMGSNASHFGLEGLGVGPPPISGDTSSRSLFGSTDMDMDMEIPGLSMSMNSGMDISMAGMGMELSSSPVPSRPPPMIVLSSPTRTPAAGTGMVELRTSFGEFNNKGGGISSDCGVKVEASAGIDTRGMDEVIRRGGIWGLPGKVWVNMGPK
ncbi:hypothetical protein J3R82DRAFT_10746 [Butyriboletus roseoflavus]|nr:hypothetical protein J3R82DRAFT_10746 [Butyriboletus roseoflavus]